MVYLNVAPAGGGLGLIGVLAGGRAVAAMWTLTDGNVRFFFEGGMAPIFLWTRRVHKNRVTRRLEGTPPRRAGQERSSSLFQGRDRGPPSWIERGLCGSGLCWPYVFYGWRGGHF